MKLETKNLTCGYGKKKVINNISLRIETGESLCLLGPNGVGKTTFFKTVLGLLPPLEGEVTINDRNISRIKRKDMAKLTAYVPQAHTIPFPFSVEEVVTMGRYAHRGITAGPSTHDKRFSLNCLAELGLSDLRKKVYTELSGGEQQMVLIARALTQETGLLILDEPTSNLDFGNKIKILNQINKLRKRGIAVIMTTHSPDHVFMCGTKVAVFREGENIMSGLPHSTVTEELLKKVYGVETKVRNLDMSQYNRVTVCVPCLN